MLMPVLAPMYMAVAASTPPSRKPVIAERIVSCGMSPRIDVLEPPLVLLRPRPGADLFFVEL